MDLFGTAGIRGDARRTVNPELALAVGRAVGQDGTEFVVGRDGRETGPALAAAVTAGIESAAGDVLRAGQVPTPALAYASQGRRGVMLTASHNPPADNGIKLFADGVEYDADAEATITDRVERHRSPATWDEWGETRTVDPLADYRQAVVDYASGHGDPPTHLTVAVDCGNGMASLATPQALRALGADVRAVNANVDGHFPGRESKPTAESLREFRRFVADGPAGVGLAHDGDADRIVVVDAEGDLVHEDTVVAILAAHFVRQSSSADPVVVTTPNASGRIDDRVEAAGGRVERVRLGALHEGIAAVRAAGDAGTAVAFAAEPWKHVHPALGGWIDGVASAAVLTRLLAIDGLATLREPVEERPYRKESVRCPDEQKAAVMKRLGTVLPARYPEATVDTDHGVRLDLPDGSWTLVRPSGTEPYVRVYAESDDVDGLVEAVVTMVSNVVDGLS